METALIPFLLITLCALSVGYLFRQRFEAALPVTMLGAMLLLYAFYALNALQAGRIVLIAACAAPVAAAAARMIQRRDFGAFVKASVFTPQMAVCLGLTVLFYILSINKLVGVWDELRLWGSLPKALHFTGALQFGENASLFTFSQSYPPAMPLLQYFFTSFTPAFSEGALFFTRAWFGLALLLPLTRNLTWNRWHGLIPIAFLMVFVPYYLTTEDPDFAFYYESLYVDAPAGILCGYLCWQAMDDCYRDRFSTAAFAVTLMALTLTKDFGVLFGGLCVAGSLKWTLRAAREKRLKSALPRIAAAGAALGAAYLSWQLLMRGYRVVNYNTIGATLPTLKSLGASLSYFLSAAFSVNASVLNVSVSYGAYLLLLTLLYALFVYRDQEDLKNDLPFLLLRLIGYGGYFFAYVMMFRDDIAGGVYPSVARYMVAMLLCETVVFLMALTRRPKRERFLTKPFPALTRGAKTSAALLTAALLALSVFTVGSFWKYDGGVYADAEEAARLAEQNVRTADGETADVWLVIGGNAWDNSLLHHRIYFDLTGTNARIKTYILQANITQSGQGYTPETFKAALLEGGYAYVLVVYGDDELAEEFGELFPELVPYETDFLLYQVNRADGGSVTLSFAGEP